MSRVAQGYLLLWGLLVLGWSTGLIFARLERNGGRWRKPAR